MGLPLGIKQPILSLGVLFNMMNLGMTIGFAAILMPALLDPGSDIPADKDQTYWLAALPGFSSLIVVFVIGPLMHLYGRRVSNFCVVTPMLMGWIVTSFSNSMVLLFLGRLLQTSGVGGTYFYATCIAEFSSPRIRGVLLNMKLFFVSTGVITIHILGYFLHWRRLALIGTVPCIMSLIITYYWPETPDWLVSKGRYDEAKSVFFSLRGRNPESDNEITKLIEERSVKKEFSEQYTVMKFLRKLKSKVLWRPVILQYLTVLLTELGGRVYFPTYSIQLAKQLSGDNTEGFMFTYIIDAVTATATLCSFYFIKKYKRRYVLLGPCYFAVALLFTTSVLLYVRTNYHDSRVMMWIILTLFALYFFIMTCTAFAISYVIIGELLPLEFRAAGAVVNGTLMCLSDIVSMRVMPILRDNLDLHGMFLVYSLCILLTLMYFQYDLPETKDRTLQDVANYFKGKSPKIRSDVIDSDEKKNILGK